MIKFEGGKELEAALKLLVDETGRTTSGKAAMRRAATKALQPFAERWRQGVPKLTGQLEQSISVGTKLTKRQAGQVRSLGKSAVEVYAGTADPAGLISEYGLAHNPAQPAGRPAWDAEQSNTLDILGREAWLQIDKTAKRAAKKRLK